MKKLISLIAAAAMLTAALPVVSMAADEKIETLWSDNFDSYKNTVEYYHEKKLDYNNKVLADGTLAPVTYEEIKGITLYTVARDGGDDSSYWQLTKGADGKNALTTQVSRFSSSGRGAKIVFGEEYKPTEEKAVVLQFDVNVKNDAETNYDESIQINGDDAYQIDFVDGLKMSLDKWETVKVVINTSGTEVFVGDSEERALKFGATSLSSISFNGLIDGIAAGDAIKAESNPFGYPTISLDNMEVYTIAAANAEGTEPTTEPATEPTAEPDASPAPEETAKPEASFAKVSDWAKETVDAAVAADLIPVEMYSDDLTANISREEFAAVAVKLYESLTGAPAPEARIMAFEDISDSQYMSYITKAYVLNIVNGTSPTEFSPKATITREQMATMLTRAIKCATIEGWSLENDKDLDVSGTAKFADDAEISAYASNSVYYMAGQGIIKGMDTTHFAPQGTATKEQSIAVAQRTYDSNAK